MKTFFKMLASVLLTSSAAIVMASPVAVSKSDCSKVDAEKPFILILDSGDDLLQSITVCAKNAKLKSAAISGLGQVHNPTLAYFTSNPNDKPSLTTMSGFYELAGFTGNITNNNNSYYTHAHAVLADEKFHGIAGHVNDAKVGLTAEITIIPFDNKIERVVDPKTGFGPIVH